MTFPEWDADEGEDRSCCTLPKTTRMRGLTAEAKLVSFETEGRCGLDYMLAV